MGRIQRVQAGGVEQGALAGRGSGEPGDASEAIVLVTCHARLAGASLRLLPAILRSRS